MAGRRGDRLYAERGYQVRILCLSYGERGEPERLGKIERMTVDRIQEDRHAESSRAAAMGAETRLCDMGHYPIVPTQEKIVEMVNEFGEHKPQIVLTHSFADPYHPDHSLANDLTLKARVYAQAAGYPAKGKGRQEDAPPVLLFEPHQPEQCNFKPQVLLDITPVWDKKLKAMESMATQEHLVTYTPISGGGATCMPCATPVGAVSGTPKPTRGFYPQVTDTLE